MIVLAKCIARCFLFGGAAALAGCASYERLPLDKESSLAASASELEGSGGKRITLAALDRLIVLNNPDLRAARAKLGVGAAQVVQAGILPNPPVAVSYPFFISGPGTVNAYSAGFTQDVKSILLLRTRGEATQNAASEISAALLWQEWQTIGKTRLLFVDIVLGERAKKLIFQSRKFLQERFDLTSTAISQGNATLATLSPVLVAVGDIQKTYDDLERLQLSRRHQLNALLGLAPDAKLALAASTDAPIIDPASIRRQLSTLADRRPDLIAFQYGYRSEDAKVRQAILSQFPNLSIGIIGGSDTSNIISFGPQLTVDLPIFDRNQGEKLRTQEDITRNQRLRDANQAQVYSDVDSAYATLNSNLNLLRPYKTRYLQQEVRIRETISFAYQNGGASLLDFLQAQQDYRTTQLNYLNLIGSYLTAAGQLNLAVGREVIQ